MQLEERINNRIVGVEARNVIKLPQCNFGDFISLVLECINLFPLKSPWVLQTQRNFKILYKEVKKPEEFYNGANNTQPTKCWVAFA